MKEIKIKGFHDLELETFIFDQVNKPKAVVLIVHGMQEHCLRYQEFANLLDKCTYSAIASDL